MYIEDIHEVDEYVIVHWWNLAFLRTLKRYQINFLEVLYQVILVK